jgi:hypothetical protein
VGVEKLFYEKKFKPFGPSILSKPRIKNYILHETQVDIVNKSPRRASQKTSAG